MDIDLDKIGSEIATPSAPLPDKLAKQEAKEKFSGDAKRAEETKQALHCGMVYFIRIAAILVIIIFSVRMVYYVLPLRYQWLSDEQVKGMDDFLFHGILGGIVGMYLKKSFKPGDEEE